MDELFALSDDPAMAAMVAPKAAAAAPSGHAKRRVGRQLPRDFVALVEARRGDSVGAALGIMRCEAVRMLGAGDALLHPQMHHQLRPAKGPLRIDYADFVVWSVAFRPFSAEIPSSMSDLVDGQLNSWVLALTAACQARHVELQTAGAPLMRLHPKAREVLRERCELVTVRAVATRAGVMVPTASASASSTLPIADPESASSSALPGHEGQAETLGQDTAIVAAVANPELDTGIDPAEGDCEDSSGSPQCPCTAVKHDAYANHVLLQCRGILFGYA